MRRFLNKLFGKTSASKSTRLELTALESRDCQSVTVSHAVALRGAAPPETTVTVSNCQYVRIEYGDNGWGGITNVMRVSTEYETVELSVPMDRTRIVIYGTNGYDNVVNYTHRPMDAYMFGGDDEVRGGTGNDTIFGGDGCDTLNGWSGNDHLNGQGQDDVLYGTDGVDFLYGEDGNDSLFGGEEGDYLYGQNGWDLLCGENGNDVLDGGSGIDGFIGGAGRDVFLGTHDYYVTPGQSESFLLFFSTTSFGVEEYDNVTDLNWWEGDVELGQVASGLQVSDIESSSYTVAISDVNIGGVYIPTAEEVVADVMATHSALGSAVFPDGLLDQGYSASPRSSGDTLHLNAGEDRRWGG